MYARKETEDVNSDAIVDTLSARLNMTSDNIDKTFGANTMKLEGLKKTADFACADTQDIKGKVSTLVRHCQQRISELERYSWRWNLRLDGVEELESEKEDAAENY